MRRTSVSFSRALITLAVVFAMGALGFAHKFDRTSLPPELAAYVAAGGSLSEICGDLDGSDGIHRVQCDACRTVDTTVLSDGCTQTRVADLEKTKAFRFVAKRLRNSQGLDPTRLTRGPPQA